MNLFGHDWSFWVALVGAAFMRVATSPFHSVVRSLLQVLLAVFVGWGFTDPTVDYFHLTPEIYRVPTGILIALTADGLVRWLLSLKTTDILDLIQRLWGGGGK